ncbi:hypothetical protein FisN_22Lu083 [Fistulifera solaris]|uniref:Uncharacterized protein n=1 Tax=Fistulifera solaris TaxID=1519565 RepID=A0A1Z5JBS3_FISSO|nr:hypothetical protein FisN_22Lu083 [Fistulifera solaris]|eukprot:GAX11396.1 hypothetical protein FisN_22Lu083 [Fistulifera solaris]
MKTRNVAQTAVASKKHAAKPARKKAKITPTSKKNNASATPQVANQGNNHGDASNEEKSRTEKQNIMASKTVEPKPANKKKTTRSTNENGKRNPTRSVHNNNMASSPTEDTTGRPQPPPLLADSNENEKETTAADRDSYTNIDTAEEEVQEKGIALIIDNAMAELQSNDNAMSAEEFLETIDHKGDIKNTAKFFKNNHPLLKRVSGNVAIYLCRCPECISKGVWAAKYTTFNVGKFENETDPSKMLEEDKYGFVDIDKHLPAGPNAKNQRAQIRRHYRDIARTHPLFVVPQSGLERGEKGPITAMDLKNLVQSETSVYHDLFHSVTMSIYLALQNLEKMKKELAECEEGDNRKVILEQCIEGQWADLAKIGGSYEGNAEMADDQL